MDIFKIAFTGGPCALKTKTISKVKEKLEEDGYYVLDVPETAAELIKAKIMPYENKNHTLRFQELVLEKQTNKERIAEEYAKLLLQYNTDLIKDKKGIIILYDRSIMDNRAYLTHEEYNNLLNKYDINELEFIDKFDMVFNLISTATLRPEFYALDGVRYETVEEAAYRDMLTSGARLTHRNLKVIKPMETEEEKINVVLGHIYNLLNRKQLDQIKEYLVDKDKTDFSKYNDDNSRKIRITSLNMQAFNGAHFNLYKREYNGHVSYIKRATTPTYYNQSFIIEDEPISFNDYTELALTNIINNKKIKDILCCIDNGEYYRFEESESGIKLYTDLEELQIPKNIVLKKKR